MRAIALAGLILSVATAHAQKPDDEADTAGKKILAGYANGSFYIKDPNDWFVVFPKGRLHIDAYFFPSRGGQPDGVDNNASNDPPPKNTILARPARADLQGTIWMHFDSHIPG